MTGVSPNSCLLTASIESHLSNQSLRGQSKYICLRRVKLDDFPRDCPLLFTLARVCTSRRVSPIWAGYTACSHEHAGQCYLPDKEFRSFCYLCCLSKQRTFLQRRCMISHTLCMSPYSSDYIFTHAWVFGVESLGIPNKIPLGLSCWLSAPIGLSLPNSLLLEKRRVPSDTPDIPAFSQI